MASMGNIEKRLEPLEAALTPPAQLPIVINCWTSNLAKRIEQALPKDHRDIRLAYLRFPDEKAELKWETSLRRSNKDEAKRLDELLAGALNQVW
jgi:hypothetical protein